MNRPSSSTPLRRRLHLGRARRGGLHPTAAILAGLVAMAAAGAGCGSGMGEGPGVGGAAVTTASATAATEPAGDTELTPSTGEVAEPTTATSTTPEPTGAEDSAPVVALAPEGLQLVDGGRITTLAFGSSRNEVTAALDAAFGASAEVEAVSDECPNQADEQLRWPGNLRVDVRDDAVISWSLDQGSPLTTVSGVGLGLTRAEVERSIVIEVTESSLGTEFTTTPDGQGLNGLLSGPGADATVTELWAGEICAFR